MTSSKSIEVLILFIILFIGSVALYNYQFQYTQFEKGLLAFSTIFRVDYLLSLIISIFVLSLTFPKTVALPSDIYLIVYLIGTVFVLAVYWPATGFLSLLDYFRLLFLFLLPVFFIAIWHFFLNQFRFEKIANAKDKSGIFLMLIFGALLIAGIVISYIIGGSAGSFEYSTGHIRRLAGRENFAGQIIPSYLLQMCMNAFAPLLAFVAGYRRNFFAAFIALGFVVFAYWLLAVKSPALNILLLFGIGIAVREQKIQYFGRVILIGLAGLLTLALIEVIFNGYSLIGGYGIRRALLVPATIQAFFWDALNQYGIISQLAGLDFSGYKTPEYMVGHLYMHNINSNANTNTLLHQFAVSGLFGYIWVVFMVVGIMCFLDFIYLSYGRAEAFAFSALIGILTLHQAITVILASSGLALSMLIWFFVSLISKYMEPAG